MEVPLENKALGDPRKSMKTWCRTAIKNVQAARDRMCAVAALFEDCKSMEKAQAAGNLAYMLACIEEAMDVFYRNA